MPTTISIAHHFLDLVPRRCVVDSGTSIRWITSTTAGQTASSIASVGGTSAHHNHRRVIEISKR